MPIARVEINGRIARIEVPEGTTPDQARQMALQAINAPKPKKPTSFWQGVLDELGKAASNGQWVMDTITGKGIVRDLTGQPTPSDLQRAQLRQQQERSKYRGSTAGRVTGAVLGALPSGVVPGGPLAQGIAGGFLNTQNPDNLTDTARDMAIGGVGGKIGDKVIGGVSRAISPRVAPVVQRLKDRGIPLTPGQIVGAKGGTIGRTVRATENKLTSVPGVGDAISNSYRRGQAAVNKAAFDEGLAPIEAQVADIGEIGVEQAQQAVSDAYTRALHGARITPDREFAGEFFDAAQLGRTPGNFADDFDRIMMDEVRPSLVDQPGELHGQNIQDALRILQGYGRQYDDLATRGANGIPQPSARPVATAFKDLSQAVEGMVERQAPAVMPKYRAANQAYRNLKVLQEAVSAAKNTGGEFSASQLAQAARANAKKFGGTHGTTNQPFFQLTRDAQEVMPSTIPDSGTAGRGLVGLLLGGVGGMPAVIASGGASIPYSRGAQKAIEGLLTGRQGPAFKSLAQAVDDYLRPVAISGGAVGLPLLLSGP